MSTTTYKITYSGELQKGQPVEQVKKNLIKLYKGNRKAIELLFKRKQVILKKNLTMDQALKSKQVFDRTGAICQIAPMELNFKKSVATGTKPSKLSSTTERPDSQGKDSLKADNTNPSLLRWAFASLFALSLSGSILYHFLPEITEWITPSPSAPQSKTVSHPHVYLLLN